MSVSMYWKPTDPNSGTHFQGASDLKSILEEMFGEFPAILNLNDIGRLEGVRACGYRSVQSLIDAISQHDSITITAIY